MRSRRPRRPRVRTLFIPLALVAGGCAGDDGGDALSTDSVDTAEAASSAEASVTADDAGTTEPAAATTAPADTDDGEGFSLSISISEPSSIDPGLSQEIEGAQVTRLLFVPLVTLGADLSLQPGVATTWSRSDDGLTWTFDLDPAATFSDGRPVVADDFVFAFARSADPDFAAPAAYQGLPIAGWAAVNEAEPSGAIGDEPVSGVVAVDDHTLTVSTDQPFALLPKVLTYPIFAPIAPEYVETEEAAAAFAERPTGNGPYVMSGPWQHNEGITVVRNESFAGPTGGPDEVEFRIYSDSLTAYKDFQAGNLDIARMVPADVVAEARESYSDTFLVTDAGVLAYIGFPVNVPPFDDPDIRKALSLAIDRDAIAERIWSGTQSAATGMVPSIVPGALAGPCDACTYDPDRAKELYEAAGGIPGNSMVVYDIADDGRAGLDPILNSWTELFGLEIEVRSFEFAQFLEETATGVPVGPFELGWAWDYPSGYSFLSPLFESSSGANNLSYADPAFDEQMRLAREAADEVAGLEFLAAGQEIVETAMPLTPITFAADLGVHSDRLANVVVDAGSFWRVELIEPA